MIFSIRNLIKPIIGLFLFGLALWANPLEASAYGDFGVTPYIPNGTSLPYNYTVQWSSELGTFSPSSFGSRGYYNNIPLTGINIPTFVDTQYCFDFNFNLAFFNTFYNVDCDGSFILEFFINYEDSSGVHSLSLGNTLHEIHFNSDTPYPCFSDVITVHCPGKPLSFSFNISSRIPNYDYAPWRFSVSPSYLGTATPDTSSSSQTFTLTGYSDPVDSSRILFTDQANGHVNDGQIFLRMSNITLTGTVPFNNPDYDISFKQSDVDPSGSRFVYAFDSFITDFHVDYEKIISDNTETIKDQFQEYFDYQPPNTSSFNSDKSTVDSSINSVSTFQSTAFSGLSSAVNDTGLDNFDFAEYGPQMSYVGLLLTSIYNIFPNKFKYVIYFVLFVGFFGVLLNAGAYIKKMRDNE